MLQVAQQSPILGLASSTYFNFGLGHFNYPSFLLMTIYTYKLKTSTAQALFLQVDATSTLISPLVSLVHYFFAQEDLSSVARGKPWG